ncbi:MAG: neutral/alkaline non-lysosomal ceramidase N-terminal domain-containing protein [Sphingobacterium sp.]
MTNINHITKIRTLIIVTSLLLTNLNCDGFQFPTDKIFRAGASKSNITPLLGGGIVGNFGIPPEAKYIHDELYARSLVLDDGTTKLVFIICDNIGLPQELCDQAKQHIHRRTNIPIEQILISSTHTHSATSAEGEGKLRRSWNKDKKLDDYQQFIALRIADAVELAIYNMVPAKIGWGSVEIPEHVFNRRWRMKDSVMNPFGRKDLVKFNPGIGNKEIVEPAGPVDPEASFIVVKTLQEETIALLANYSLHYVGGVPNNHISADYYGVFAERIRELLQKPDQEIPMIGIMSNGTSGDINNINVKAPKVNDPPYNKMQKVANDIAQKIYLAQQEITFHSWVKLQSAQSKLQLQIRKPNQEELIWAKKIINLPLDSSPINHPLERTYAERVLQLSEEWPDQISIVLQTFKIGDLQIAAIPFETFAQTGLALKSKNTNKTFTISFGNGSYGYLPTPEQHELGGYETWLGTNRVEKDASDKIASKIMNQFKSMSLETNNNY